MIGLCCFSVGGWDVYFEDEWIQGNNSYFYILAMIGSLIALKSKLSCPEALKKKINQDI